MKKLVFILFLSIISFETISQSFYNRRINRRWEASGSIGYTASLTELTPDGNYFDPKLNIGGDLQYKFGGRFNARLGLEFFQLSGSDQDIPESQNTRPRGLSYTSNNIELNATVAISLFPHTDRFIQRKLINPYAFAGVGLLYFDPRAEVPGQIIRDGVVISEDVPKAGQRVSLAKYNTEREDYSRFTIVVPMGIGVRVKVNQFMDISGEVGGRLTFTDYLDDISSENYPDISEFDLSIDKDRTAAALSSPLGNTGQRGNPDSNDYYMLFKIKANFYIQGKFLDGLFGIGGKKFNIKPRRRSGFGKRR